VNKAQINNLNNVETRKEDKRMKKAQTNFNKNEQEISIV
jgi:hypothetical protein